MPAMTVRIRPAQAFDAAFAAPLLQETIGQIGHALTGTHTDADAAHVLAAFFAQRGHRLSYTHVLVAEVQGRPVGLAAAYPGDLSAALDDPWRAHRRSLGLSPDVESEGQPGELYLDTLAVSGAARGQGVGGALLGAVVERAARLGFPRVGLWIGAGNPAARLYARHGFVAGSTRTLAGEPYTHMARPVAPPHR